MSSVIATEKKGSATMPQMAAVGRTTPNDAIDGALAVLNAHKDAWVQVSVAERIALIQRLRRDTFAAAPELIRDAAQVKGIVAGSAFEADEWTSGPYSILRNLRLLERSLRDIQRYGAPRLPGKPWTRPDGQVVAPVMPVNLYDRLLLNGYSAEIWMDPEVGSEELEATMAVAYQRKHRGQTVDGKVALVLGAGNVTSIGPMDALYKLFVEDQVVLLKTNPVNDYTGPFLEKAFAALFEGNFMRVVYGGAEVGRYVCDHPLVSEIHITGSDKTHDAIVFGGADRDKNKAAGVVVNSRRISSELGDVSPVIVVPGPWSRGDLGRQGANIATALTNNAGFNCLATRVIVQREGWSQRRDLLDAVRKTFVQTPTRKAYYPGAVDRHESFVGRHPEAEMYGNPAEGELPWTLIAGLNPDDVDDICFNTEAFCSLTSEVGLAAESVAGFVDAAVDFCNEVLWGTLSCWLIVHPDSLADPAVAQAVDRAVAKLRYGNVCVNHFPGLGYAFSSTSWGAFPGHDVFDIRSGIGSVHNSFMFDRLQKTVVRGPFRPIPKPPWWVTNKTALQTAKLLTAFEASPSPAKLPRIVWSALRG